MGEAGPTDFLCLSLLVAGLMVLAAIGGAYAFLRISSAGRKTEKPAEATDAQADVQEEQDYTLQQACVYTIVLPRGATWEPEEAHSFMANILLQFEKLTFRIIAEQDKISWQILDLRLLLEPAVVLQAIRTFYPEAEVKVEDYQNPEFVSPFWRYLNLYRLGNEFYAPVKYVSAFKKIDPMTSLAQAMVGLKEGERIIYTLHVGGPVDGNERKRLSRKITISTVNPLQFLSLTGIGFAVVRATTGDTRAPKFVRELQKLFETRLNSHQMFNAYLVTQVDATERADLGRLLLNIYSIIYNDFGSDYNAFFPQEFQVDAGEQMPDSWLVETPEKEQRTSAVGLLGAWAAGIDTRYAKVRAPLSTWELAAMWHLPHEGFTVPSIAWIESGRAPEVLLENTAGVLLGDNVIAESKHPIRLHQQDRATHMNIVGRTGVGKSTFMHNLIHQDIASGKGVGVVDPHGKLVQDILRASIPDERIDDVVVIDIANEKYPPPFNPLATSADSGSMAAGQVVAVLDKIYGGILKTPRIARTLAAALVLLTEEKSSTLRDIPRLFHDVEYRQRLLYGSKSLKAHDFWHEFDNQSRSVQQQLSLPVVYRIESFYDNPVLYPMLCHPNALDFARLISEKKIVLISLGVDERKVPGPEQQLLGAVLVSQMQMAAMHSLSNITPFFLYIDEVQNFVTTSLNVVFEEARKYGLHLTVGNQYMGQLQGKILNSVMGTVGTTVVFQVGLDDSRKLAPYLKPEFEAEDLINLDLYRAVVKTRFRGQTQPAFNVATRPPPEHTSDVAERRELFIRGRSVELHTPMTKEQVIGWLEKRYPLPSRHPAPQAKSPDQPPVDDINWVDTPD